MASGNGPTLAGAASNARCPAEHDGSRRRRRRHIISIRHATAIFFEKMSDSHFRFPPLPPLLQDNEIIFADKSAITYSRR